MFNTIKNYLLILMWLGLTVLFGYWGYFQGDIKGGTGIFGAFFLGAGLTGFTIFIPLFIWTLFYIIISRKTTGKIVYQQARVTTFSRSTEMKRTIDVPNQSLFENEKAVVYRRKFQFTDHHGVSHLVETKVETNERFKEGQEVGIIYPPRRPQKARLNSFMQLWTPAIVFFFQGIVFSIVGALILEILD